MFLVQLSLYLANEFVSLSVDGVLGVVKLPPFLGSLILPIHNAGRQAHQFTKKSPV